MSQWHEKEKKDISFSDDNKELHIYIDSDDNGSIYVSVKVSELLMALGERGLLT